PGPSGEVNRQLEAGRVEGGELRRGDAADDELGEGAGAAGGEGDAEHPVAAVDEGVARAGQPADGREPVRGHGTYARSGLERAGGWLPVAQVDGRCAQDRLD